MKRRSRLYFEKKAFLKEHGYLPGHEWMCHCGHWEESGYHCTFCGNEPPWGCPCDLCQSAGWDDEDDGDDWDRIECGCPYDDADQQYDYEGESAGFVCMVCNHDQEQGGRCVNCGFDQLDEIFM